MTPTARNVVITRRSGFSASSWCNVPMWSASVWVSQIHLRSPGSMTDRRAGRNCSLSTTAPVSTRMGSEPWRTNALMGTNPMPGTGKLDVSTSMSGVALYEVIIHDLSFVDVVRLIVHFQLASHCCISWLVASPSSASMARRSRVRVVRRRRAPRHLVATCPGEAWSGRSPAIRKCA